MTVEREPGVESDGRSVPACPLMRTWKSFSLELVSGKSLRPFDETFEDGFGPFLVILAVRHGSVEVRSAGRKTVAGPSQALCTAVNDFEVTALTQSARAEGVIFLPGVVNGGFFLKNILDPASPWNDTERMDLWLLEPFLRIGNRQAVPLLPPLDDRAFTLMKEIGTFLTDGTIPFRACLGRTALFELLFLVRRGASGAAGAIDGDSDPLMARIMLYLGGNFHTRVTLAQLAVRFAVNRTDLSRRFRRRSGMTIHDFLTEQRLLLAERIVRETNLPLPDVPERVGLSDPTHFIRLFRRRFLSTPKRYRDRFRSTESR